MATTEVCRDLIGIIQKYTDPITAQFCVEKYCDKIKISTEDFYFSDLPKFIIYLAKERGNLRKMTAGQFEKLLKDLMYFSNLDDKNSNKDNSEQDEDIIFT